MVAGDRAMNPFQRVATFIVARDMSFFAIGGGTLMVAYSFHLPLALAIGASVALLLSVVLLLRAGRLTDERLVRSEAWRSLEPEDRPQDAGALRQAREGYEDLLFRVAKATAGHAAALFVAALAVSFSDRISPTHTILTASIN
jgi:hypothetical protein